MKKFFSLVLALVMALSLTTVAWGATPVSAGDFTALKTALTNGESVKLTDNITATGLLTVPAGKSATLDLNGYTITADTGRGFVVYVEEGASLTINATNGGGITNNNTAGHAITNYGTLVVNGGTFVGDYALYNGAYTNANAIATLNGGTFSANASAYYSIANCSKMVVSGATINDYVSTSGDFKMTSGSVENLYAVSADAPVASGNSTVIDGGSVDSLLVYTGSTDTVKNDVVISDGEISDFEVEVASGATIENDIAISGGTFSEAPPAEYVTDGLRYDSATGELTTMPTTGVGKYDLYDANGDLYKENITVEYVEAYDDEGAGNIDYYKLTYDGVTYTYFVECSRTKAECYLTLADNFGAYKHLKHVDYVDYVATGKAYTNIGDDCGELDVSAKAKAYVVTDEDGVKTYFVADDASPVVIKVGNELVAVDVVADGLVPHVWVVTSYNDKEEPATVKCKNCPATGKLYATKLAAPIGATFDDTQVAGYWVVVNGTAAAGDKVESAETFDAGIAMYVGMSVMAAAGSAVVLKKKD